jgi:hypothetical protein
MRRKYIKEDWDVAPHRISLPGRHPIRFRDGPCRWKLRATRLGGGNSHIQSILPPPNESLLHMYPCGFGQRWSFLPCAALCDFVFQLCCAYSPSPRNNAASPLTRLYFSLMRLSMSLSGDQWFFFYVANLFDRTWANVRRFILILESGPSAAFAYVCTATSPIGMMHQLCVQSLVVISHGLHLPGLDHADHADSPCWPASLVSASFGWPSFSSDTSLYVLPIAEN